LLHNTLRVVEMPRDSALYKVTIDIDIGIDNSN